MINYLPETIKLNLNEPHENRRLTVVQNGKTKLTYNVECMFESQEGTVNLDCLSFSNLQAYLLHNLRHA